jgi:CDGSH-type Zn-finger protein/uncharacterized Fe-S cluster protein YjdI
MTEKLHTYPGTTLTVTFDARRCIHAGECVRGLPNVFDPQRKPWVNPDGASATAIMGVVERCPSGALKYRFGEGAASERPAKTNTATLAAAGPLFVRGDIEIRRGSDDAVVLRDTRVALCRCGQSANKPFCDGAHAGAGFDDPGSVGQPKVKPGDAGAGGATLRVRVKEGGPLTCEGDLQIVDATGATAWRGTYVVLCRCGASRNKPFCDGSHKAAGFAG